MCYISRSAEPVQKLALLAGKPEKPGGLEQSNPQVSRYQSRQTIQPRRDRENQKTEEMVVQKHTNSRLLEKVERIYNWLDSEIAGHNDLAAACRACGACCDFESPAQHQSGASPSSIGAGFDHRLFVTTPEIIYLAAKIGAENIKPMTTGRCPYQANGKCTVYDNRFAGCRIFCCKANMDFQSSLSEAALKKLKAVCSELQISYRYVDLAAALNGFAG